MFKSILSCSELTAGCDTGDKRKPQSLVGSDLPVTSTVWLVTSIST